VQIIGKNGLAMAIVIALGVFFLKKIWPDIERRLQSADNERRENLQRMDDQAKMFVESLKQEREEKARRFDEQARMFMQALQIQNARADEKHKESIKAQNRIADKLETIDKRLRNGNGK
jgi:hypothetical protein